MATNNKPTNTLRCGNINATISQNVSEKGPYFSTTFRDSVRWSWTVSDDRIETLNNST